MKDERARGLEEWARKSDREIPGSASLLPVSDDASFRRYFRFDAGAEGRIFVDAPPEHEDNESFLKVSAALNQSGLNCPVVLEADVGLGYMVITDLGDTLYLGEIRAYPERTESLYQQAIDALVTMLGVSCDLPAYGADKLRQEMNLFHEWFLPQQLKMDVTADVREMLDQVQSLLVDNCFAQPQAFVHRDYHCRNLMVVEDNGPGILDFQDAVIGPITYDLVSLYKDCYYRFERQAVVEAVGQFQRRLVREELVPKGSPMLRWFDLMGAQRHLKCAGIFSRLNLRDGKSGYLPDIPLVIEYLVEVAGLYDELADFGTFLRAEVQPRLQRQEFQR